MRAFRAGNYQHFLLFLLSLAGALVFFNAKGTDDVQVWQRWMAAMGEYGVPGGYARMAPDYPYPPLSFAALAAVSKSAFELGITDRTALKLSLLLALIITALLFYALTRAWLLTAGLTLALIPNSVDLAYLDIYFAPFLIGALWAAQRRKWALFTVLFTITCLIKWQPLMLAPFLALYILHIRSVRDLRAVPWRPLLIQVAAPALLVAGAVLTVFGWPVVESLQHATRFPVLSAQGLNFNWVLTYLLHVLDPTTYGPLIDGEIRLIILPENSLLLVLPKLIFFAVYGFILLRFLTVPKTFPSLLLYALLGYLAYFTFNTGVHENHLFPTILLTAVLAHLRPAELPLFATWALATNLNPFIFYGIEGRALPWNRMIWSFDPTLPLALLNVLLFLALLWRVVRDEK